MPNKMATMQGCCCGCLADFSIEHLGGNEYRFTDISPGSHTRVWVSGDGGTSTASPWTHTFPNDNVYSVKLTIDTGEEICDVTKWVGDFIPCSYCDPVDLPQTTYVTIPSAGEGPVAATACKTLVLPQLPGTYAMDDPTEVSCGWGVNTYAFGTCLTCPAQGFSYNHSLFADARIFNIGSDIALDCSLRVRASTTVSSDCTTVYNGGGADYRKLFGVSSPVSCYGMHTLSRLTGFPWASDGYVAWPSTVTVFIPPPS